MRKIKRSKNPRLRKHKSTIISKRMQWNPFEWVPKLKKRPYNDLK